MICKLKWNRCVTVHLGFLFFSIRSAIAMENKLKLYGFNNLTKALSFNIYDVCYAKSEREQKDYIAYIDEQYNSERLTNIMTCLLYTSRCV